MTLKEQIARIQRDKTRELRDLLLQQNKRPESTPPTRKSSPSLPERQVAESLACLTHK